MNAGTIRKAIVAAAVSLSIAAVSTSVLLQVVIIFLPVTHPIFQTTVLTPMSWALVITLALVPVTIIEFVKFGYHHFALDWNVGRGLD
jgi:hypothetical protein